MCQEVSLELSERVREQMKEIRESFPDILDKFIPVNSSLDPQPPPPPTATTPAPATAAATTPATAVPTAASTAAGSVGSLVPVGSAGRGDGVTGSGTSPTVSAGSVCVCAFLFDHILYSEPVEMQAVVLQ